MKKPHKTIVKIKGALMKNNSETGINRTGIQLSPREAKKTIEGAREGKSSSRGSEKEMKGMRTQYIQETEGVGSLPSAKMAKGKGAKKIQEKQMALLLDKLSERLAFERTGVRLYDTFIHKVGALNESSQPSVDDLQHIRDEELDHFKLVSEAILQLGGDPTVESPCANTTGVASSGILKVLADPRTNLPQCLSAILTAERTDIDGWELLIQLADRLGLENLVKQFQEALSTEDEHLQKVKRWLTQGLMEEAA
jgi:bacterioferritin (cytochrome b1)